MMKIPVIKGMITLLLALSINILCAQTSDLLTLAKDHFNKQTPSLTEQQGFDWIITDQTTNAKNGVTYVYLRQTYQGIEISNANSNMAMKNGEIIHHSGKIISKIVQSTVAKTPILSPSEAVIRTANHLALSITEPLTKESMRTDNPNFSIFSKGGISLEPIPVKLVYWQNEKEELRLAYDLSIYPLDQENWWSIRIDASTSEILERGNWVTKCQFDLEPHKHSSLQLGHAEVQLLDELPVSSEQYRVIPYPIESPNHGVSSLEVAPYNAIASPFGWHDTNGVSGAEHQITRGNNVYAYEDRNDLDIPGFSPNGGATLDFNFAPNFEQTPLDYQSASITNLFYWNNIIHDIFTHYGFDEQSGNFQVKNYSGQGLENDAVQAEDQDGSGTNNANFGTPPDGSEPRMQMYLWESNEGGFELIINSPGSIAGTYAATGAEFGSVPTNTLTGNLVLVNDGSANPTQGCGALLNGPTINGNIAVIDRGNCTFAEKVKRAQTVGAIAVLVINNVAGDPINMGGDDPTITIPVLMVSLSLGNQIKANLPGVNVTFNDNRKFITSSFDNGIITHEYGHGISTRLAGGASNSGCLSSVEQMGEGWSDYFGLMLQLKAGDQSTDLRGIGTYAAGQSTSGQGIRPAQYTTDMAVNSYTYADLDNSAISEPHGIGFLWCTMIWDMTWKMIERHGFDEDIYTGNGGNNMALQLVIDGLKLQVCNPGFVDGRDAILLADRLNNGGANQDIIWEAFARRGLGAYADQGSPNNRSDGKVSFEMPTSLQINTSVSDQYAHDGDIITYSIMVENIFSNPQSNILITDELPAGLDIIVESLSEGGSINGTTVQFALDQLNGQESVTFSFQAQVTGLSGTPYLFFDNHESGFGNWSKTAVKNTNQWTRQSNNPNGGTKAWFVANPSAVSEQILTLTESVIVTENTKLAIYHDYNTEGGFDGGIVEFALNGGSNWSDLGSKMIENGYNSTLQSGGDNPIQGKKAFSGTSQGYIKTIISLEDYAGSEVSIRFRFASDIGVGGVGWYVDEVLFYVGEEDEIVNEACLTYSGQSDPICSASAGTTVLSNEDVCIVNAGKITASSALPLTICANDNSAFIIGNNSTSSEIQYHYFVTSTESPNNILLTSNSGTIDHSNLEEGSYMIWGFAYDNGNDESDISTYLSSVTTIEELQLAIEQSSICAHLTNRFSNGNTTELVKTECTPLSSEVTLNSNITLYPNPSNGEVTIAIKDFPLGEGVFSLINLSGQSLLTEKVRFDSSDVKRSIDLSSISSGLYIVQMEINNEIHQGRLVIE